MNSLRLKRKDHHLLPVIRFLVILGLTYAALWALYEFVYLYYYVAVAQAHTDPFSQFVAWLSAILLQVLGYDASVLITTDRFGAEVALDQVGQVIVVPSCSGAKNLFVLFGLLFAFPGPIKKKLWYIPAALLFLIIFNSIRVSGLALLHDGSLADHFSLIKPVLGYFNHIALFLIFVGWLQLSSKKS